MFYIPIPQLPVLFILQHTTSIEIATRRHMMKREQMTAPAGNVEDRPDALQGGNEGPSPGRRRNGT